ncbi:hypothetical protein PG991_000494 [Apiospora marii]|uniref:Uncharacterized protein n=1 Tax=Apiospora marii TaxID=335849 RepID=A0ABR1T294_9PEZI
MGSQSRTLASSSSLDNLRPTIPESWDLQGQSLELDEVLTASTVSRFGTIISRRGINDVFNILQVLLDIHIQNLPPWLQDVQMKRDAYIVRMNRQGINLPQIMKELDILTLSGIASFVVFCCRYSEDKETIKGMMHSLTTGKLGTVVKFDEKRNEPISHTYRDHIATFVSSNIDADRNSSIYKLVCRNIEELCRFGGMSATKDMFQRRRQESIDLMGKLLGAPGVEGPTAASQEWREEDSEHGGWAAVHNTLHLTSAYIALAAQAHDALVAVECVSDVDRKMFSSEKIKSCSRKSTFLVRLWLKQPPEHIHGILRHSYPSNKSDNATGTLDIADEGVTVVGGSLEMAQWVAKKQSFQCSAVGSADTFGQCEQLWHLGIECAKTWRWVVKRGSTTNSSGSLLMVLEKRENQPTKLKLPQETAPLVQALQKKEKRLRKVARDVAKVIDDHYSFEDYSELLRDRPDDKDPEAIQAMLYVITAMSVKLLGSTVSLEGDSTDSYALNLSTLDQGSKDLGNLYHLFCTALVEGVAPFKVLMAVATVWGGAAPGSTSFPKNQLPVEEMLGVITGHCAVIFDGIRNLSQFVEKVQPGRLFSIWRGAVPMLPRDPRTDCIYSGHDVQQCSEIGSGYSPPKRNAETRLKGRLLITFEPSEMDGSKGVFCFWFGGNLVAECAPRPLLTSVLSGMMPAARDDSSQTANTTDTSMKPPPEFVDLPSSSLLDIQRFRVTGDVCVIIKGSQDAAWASFAFACASGLSSMPRHLSTFVHRGNLDTSDMESYRPRMGAGQVLIEVPYENE